eukprot:11603-Heterococcus_DN1.PRE.2
MRLAVKREAHAPRSVVENKSLIVHTVQLSLLVKHQPHETRRREALSTLSTASGWLRQFIEGRLLSCHEDALNSPSIVSPPPPLLLRGSKSTNCHFNTHVECPIRLTASAASSSAAQEKRRV